jgi:hypothetical protein
VRDLFGSIVDTQMTMVRSLVDRVPKVLLNVVLGWSCLLFFGYALLSTFDEVTVVLCSMFDKRLRGRSRFYRPYQAFVGGKHSGQATTAWTAFLCVDGGNKRL